METRAKKKGGLSMRSGSRKNLIQHTAEPMMAMDSPKNSKLRKPEVNTVLLPPPGPRPGQERSKPSSSLLSPPASKPVPGSSSDTPERAESTPKRKTSRTSKGKSNETSRTDISTPKDKHLIPEGDFSPIELYPSSQTEALVRWEWQKDGQGSAQPTRRGGRLSTNREPSDSPQPSSLKRRSPSPEHDLLEPPVKKVAGSAPSALNDLELALWHVQARVSQLSPVAEIAEKSEDEEDSYHVLVSSKIGFVQEVKADIVEQVNVVSVAITEQAKPEAKTVSVESAAIAVKPINSESLGSNSKLDNKRADANVKKLVCAKPGPSINTNQATSKEVIPTKCDKSVPTTTTNVTVTTDNAKTKGAEEKTVEEELRLDDSMMECLIACSIQAEEECRLSQELSKNASSNPNVGVATKVTVNPVPSKEAVKPTPQVPNKPGSNILSNITKVSNSTLEKPTLPTSSVSVPTKPSSIASKPNADSIFTVPNKPIDKPSSNKATVGGRTSESRLHTVTSTMLPPPRRSPRTLSLNNKKTSPHKRTLSPSHKLPLVLSQSTPETDFNPSWVAGIKSAASPMHSSLSNRSISENQASQPVVSTSSGQANKCGDSKSISRTLFSSPATTTRKPSPKPNPQANKSFDPFEDSFDAAFDNFDELDQIVLSQLEKPEESKKLSSQFQSSFLPNNDKVSLQVTTSSQSSGNLLVASKNQQQKPAVNKPSSLTNSSSVLQKTSSSSFNSKPASLPVNSVQRNPNLLQTRSSSFPSNNVDNNRNSMSSTSIQNKPTLISTQSKPGYVPQVGKTSSSVNLNTVGKPSVPQNQSSAKNISSRNTRQSTSVTSMQSKPCSNVPSAPTGIKNNQTNNGSGITSNIVQPLINSKNIQTTNIQQVVSKMSNNMPSASVMNSVVRNNIQSNGKPQPGLNSTNKKSNTAQVNSAIVGSNLNSNSGAHINSNFSGASVTAQTSATNNIQNVIKPQITSNIPQNNGNMNSSNKPHASSSLHSTRSTAQSMNVLGKPSVQLSGVKPAVPATSTINNKPFTSTNMANKQSIQVSSAINKPTPQSVKINNLPQSSTNIPSNSSFQANKPLMQTSNVNNKTLLQTVNNNKPSNQISSLCKNSSMPTLSNKLPVQGVNYNNKHPQQSTNVINNNPSVQNVNIVTKPPVPATSTRPPLSSVTSSNAQAMTRPVHTIGGSMLTRHKSADFGSAINKPVVPNTVNQLKNAASPLIRHKSVGDFSSAPGTVSQKCSAEEIERKRQEAIKQRLKCSAEEIERKRQEAKQRLELRRQQQQQQAGQS